MIVAIATKLDGLKGTLPELDALKILVSDTLLNDVAILLIFEVPQSTILFQLEHTTRLAFLLAPLTFFCL